MKYIQELVSCRLVFHYSYHNYHVVNYCLLVVLSLGKLVSYVLEKQEVCHQGYSQVAGLHKGHQFSCSFQSLLYFCILPGGRVQLVSPSFQVLMCNLVMAGGTFSTYLVRNHLLPSIAGEELSLFTGGMVTEWNQTYVYYDDLLALDNCRVWGSGHLKGNPHTSYLAELGSGARRPSGP